MIVKRKEKIQSVVSRRQRDIIVVLEDIHDPHNAAAILRTCDGLGIQNVWYIFENESPYNPKKIGKATSSSANKWLDFTTFTSSKDCIQQLKKDGYDIVVTALTDHAVALPDFTDVQKKLAIVVGNEHRGASEEILAAADTVLMIPMAGFVQSYNVSVATAIVLWDITNKRHDSMTLDKNTQQKLVESFSKR